MSHRHGVYRRSLLSLGLAAAVAASVPVDCPAQTAQSRDPGTVRQTYTEIAGRIMALYVGTISIDMIMQGLQSWMQSF